MSYQKELDFARELASEAGKIMRTYFRSEDINTTWKGDNTPLTVADTTINRLVIDRVKKQFPDHGIIGEEESFSPDRDFVWVVDPIDGTMPFSLGMPNSTFSLALVERKNGQPIVAVAYDPQLDHLYSATVGGGASLNGSPIRTALERDLKQGYVFVWHGGYNDKVYFDKGKLLDFIHEKAGRYFIVPSFVYYASRVASGEFRGAILDYGSPWDSAAVALLVKEAGGVALDLNGNERRYDEFGSGCLLAANQEIADTLLSLIKEAK